MNYHRICLPLLTALLLAACNKTPAPEAEKPAAATAESGFTSLEQIAAERHPLRLFSVARSKHQTATMGLTISRVLEVSGFSQDGVIAWGGRVYTAADSRLEAISRGDVDVIASPAYTSWGPSWGQCWMVAQIRLNLRFLPIADEEGTLRFLLTAAALGALYK